MTEKDSAVERRALRSRQAILEATRELLAHGDGVGALTVEAVAARAGIAKTTIYRRWRDKWALALDAVMIDMLAHFDDPVDVGDTRRELLTFVNSVVTTLAARPYGPAMQGLVSEIATNPELARVYREQVVEPRLRQLRPVIERGIRRGDLRTDTDLRLVHELLIGPIFYRLLFSGAPLDGGLGTRIVDAILEGFGARTGRASGARAQRSRSRPPGPGDPAETPRRRHRPDRA